MQYFGGKAKIAKPLSIFLNSQLNIHQPFVDLFCGSCNIISKIDDTRTRLANDMHYELIEMHKGVQYGIEPPSSITEDIYNDMRHDKNIKYPAWLRGFIGFGSSFSGKYFGGYAKGNDERNYCMNAKNSILKKHSTLKNVEFSNKTYSDVILPKQSLVYCDIPYKNTTSYSTGPFCHNTFYEWAVKTQQDGHVVLVSEYKQNLPEGWVILWEHESNKSIRNAEGVQESTIEIVMRPRLPEDDTDVFFITNNKLQSSSFSLFDIDW